MKEYLKKMEKDLTNHVFNRKYVVATLTNRRVIGMWRKERKQYIEGFEEETMVMESKEDFQQFVRIHIAPFVHDFSIQVKYDELLEGFDRELEKQITILKTETHPRFLTIEFSYQGRTYFLEEFFSTEGKYYTVYEGEEKRRTRNMVLTYDEDLYRVLLKMANLQGVI